MFPITRFMVLLLFITFCLLFIFTADFLTKLFAWTFLAGCLVFAIEVLLFMFGITDPFGIRKKD